MLKHIAVLGLCALMCMGTSAVAGKIGPKQSPEGANTSQTVTIDGKIGPKQRPDGKIGPKQGPDSSVLAWLLSLIR